MTFIKVGVYPSFPIAYKEKNSEEIKGIGIDVWKQIAKELKLEYQIEYLDKNSYSEAMDLVANGTIQVLIGNVFSRHNRYRYLNFSRGYLRDTIQALMRAGDFYQKLLTVAFRTILIIFSFIAVVTLLNIFLLYIDVPPAEQTVYNWIETSYKTAFVFATGDISITPNTVLGKVMVLSYAILGVIFVGIIAANFVNVYLTTANYINNIEDARKFSYVVKENSIPEEIAKESGLNYVTSTENYMGIIGKMDTFQKDGRTVDGILGNKLSMIYAQSRSGLKAATLGLAPYVFANLDYCFALNDNLPKVVVKDINAQIELLREQGFLDMFTERYVPGFASS